MKRLTLCLCLALLVGCGAEETKVTKGEGENTLRLKGDPNTYKIREFEYDGCEYIGFGTGNCFTVTHKGNCKYCAERAKKK